MSTNGRRPGDDQFPCASLTEALPHLRRPPSPAAVRFKVQNAVEEAAQLAASVDAIGVWRGDVASSGHTRPARPPPKRFRRRARLSRRSAAPPLGPPVRGWCSPERLGVAVARDPEPEWCIALLLADAHAVWRVVVGRDGVQERCARRRQRCRAFPRRPRLPERPAAHLVSAPRRSRDHGARPAPRRSRLPVASPGRLDREQHLLGTVVRVVSRRAQSVSLRSREARELELRARHYAAPAVGFPHQVVGLPP